MTPLRSVHGHCRHLHTCCVKYNAAERTRWSALRIHHKHALHAQAFQRSEKPHTEHRIQCDNCGRWEPLCGRE